MEIIAKRFVWSGSVFNFVSMAFCLISEAECGQNQQSLVNTGNSGNSLY